MGMRQISWLLRCFLLCFLAMGILGGATTPAPAPTDSPPLGPASPEQAYEALDFFLQDQVDALGMCVINYL
ncbi:hypothetical protein ACVWY0_002731 [Arthrobacter sp. UYNi723]